jgi:PAS domain S-box-containing protein
MTLPLSERAQLLAIFGETGQRLTSDQWPHWRVLRGEVLAGPTVTRTRIQTLDAGREIWVETSGAPIHNRDGQITGAVLVTRDITARRALERQVAEQASQLEGILAAMSDGVAVYAQDRRLVHANQAWQAMFHHIAELRGRSADPALAARPFAKQAEEIDWQAAVGTDGKVLPLEALPASRALQGETVAGLDAVDERFESSDGWVFEVSVTAAPIRDASGHLTGAVVVGRDVTERRRLERQVAKQAAQLEAIFEAQADGVLVFDHEGRVVRANPTWHDWFRTYANLSGLSADPTFAVLPFAEQVARWTQLQRTHRYLPRDADGRAIPLEQLPFARALRGETVTGANAIDERFVLPDGSLFETSVSAAPIRDAAGSIVGGVTVVRDVTARRQLERQLAERERQYRTLVEHSPDIITRFDPALRHVYVSPRAEATLGIPAHERLGKTYAEVGLPEALYKPWEQALREVFVTGEPYAFDTTSPVGGGDAPIHHYRVRYIPELGTDGSVESVLSITTDITDLRQTEHRLAEQERLFRTLVEHSPDIIARVDRDLRYVYVSTQWETATGLRAQDLLGKTETEVDLPATLGLSAEQYAVWIQAITQAFATGEDGEVEFEFPGPTGTRAYLMRLVPEQAEDGSAASVLTVTADITTLKRTEQALREANTALETARQEEERRKQIAESLRGVLAVLNSEQSPQQVLQYIVGQAEELLGSAAAVIYGPDQLVEPAPQQTVTEGLRVQAAQGLRLRGRRLPPHRHLPFADALVAQALTLAQPVALVQSGGRPPTAASTGDGGGEVAGTAAIPSLAGTLPAPYQALLAVPIRVPDGVYGCMLMLYTQPYRFSSEEVALAQAYADQVAQAISNARLQIHREAEAATAERARLANELHDTVTQEIFSASLIAETLPTVWQTHRADAEAALGQLHELTRSAQAGLRALLLELRPGELEHAPLAESLQKLGAAMAGRAQVPVTVDVTSLAGAEPPLPPAVKVAFYRVAQEALMNAAKYAQAHAIGLQVRTGGKGRLELEIADDGPGFDLGTVPTGHYGLTIMQERAGSVGARVQVWSQPGQGTRVVMAWRQGRRPSQRSEGPEPEEGAREGLEVHADGVRR